MMKNILLIAIFFCSITFGIAVVTRYYGDPAHPGKCVIGKLLILSPGSHKDREGCARIECARNGFVGFYSCDVQPIEPGCTLGGVLKPDTDYPDCCERDVICE